MATIFSHPAIAIGLFPWFRDVRNSKKIALTGLALTALPDLDVIGLYLGIPYDHMLGHRGLTHSLFFAGLVALMISWHFSRSQKIQIRAVWLYLFASMASHGVIDAMTNGGLGIAFFAPFDNARFFFSVRPIEVSTLNIRHFFEGQGVGVLISELIYLWPACLVVATAGTIWKRKQQA